MTDRSGAPSESLRRDEELAAAVVGTVVPHDAPIVLVEYDPSWPATYDREAAAVRSVLGGAVVLLEHVGSTSVPGLAAKPIIDMVIVVEDAADEPAYVPAMEAAGYVLRIREPDWWEHRLFRGPGATINLHVFGRSGLPEVARMLAFRDRLRDHPDDRRRYETTKRELAARHWRHVQHYADAKSAVVEAIIARATESPDPR